MRMHSLCAFRFHSGSVTYRWSLQVRIHLKLMRRKEHMKRQLPAAGKITQIHKKNPWISSRKEHNVQVYGGIRCKFSKPQYLWRCAFYVKQSWRVVAKWNVLSPLGLDHKATIDFEIQNDNLIMIPQSKHTLEQPIGALIFFGSIVNDGIQQLMLLRRWWCGWCTLNVCSLWYNVD